MNVTLVIIGIFIISIIYIIAIYNGFIVLKIRIQEALSGIDVQLKRRADLIPNLIETVREYEKHEKEVFAEVSKARSSLVSAKTLTDKATANDQLSGALKNLFAIAEAYPELKASVNFQELQRQLEDTEDKVAYSRQFYNSNVRDYNAKAQTFPSSLIASSFEFTPYEFFVASDQEKKEIKVKFT